jgi:hypothetical protein
MGGLKMSDTKSAILFYNHGKDKSPIPFAKYKYYDVATGYVAIYEIGYCILCRLLDDGEISAFNNKAIHTLVLKNFKGYDISEVRVIILNSKLKSIDEADSVVNTYMKALKEKG